MIRGRLRPLTKNATNGTYVKYYPSVAFLPSVALGALLTTNISCDKGASATFQSKLRMSSTSSTAHPELFHVKATSAALLTRDCERRKSLLANIVLGIVSVSWSYRPSVVWSYGRFFDLRDLRDLRPKRSLGQ